MANITQEMNKLLTNRQKLQLLPYTIKPLKSQKEDSIYLYPSLIALIKCLFAGYVKIFIQSETIYLILVNHGFVLQAMIFIIYTLKLHWEAASFRVVYSLHAIFVVQLGFCCACSNIKILKGPSFQIASHKWFIIYQEVVKILCGAISIAIYLLPYYSSHIYIRGRCINIFYVLVISGYVIFCDFACGCIIVLLDVSYWILRGVEKLGHILKKRLARLQPHTSMHIYKYDSKIGNMICVICMEDIKNGQNATLLSCYCDVYYHYNCVNILDSIHLKCTHCRRRVYII